jgi:lipopolysaccharide export system permease protein
VARLDLSPPVPVRPLSAVVRDRDVEMAWPIPLLQRYIFAEILRVFVFVVVCLTVLLIFVGVVREASERGLGPLQILEVLPYLVPSMLPFTIPAALLLTICVVYGRIAGDQEVTAAKAAGISVLSLLWPAFVIGGALSVLSLLLTDQAIPWAMVNIERKVVTAMEDVFLDRLRTEHQYRDPKHGIDVTVHGVEGRRLIGPILRWRKSKGEIGTIQAEEAEIELDLPNRRAMLYLTNAYIDVPPRVGVYIAGRHREPIEWTDESQAPKPRNRCVQDLLGEMRSVQSDEVAFEEQQAVELAMALTTGDFPRLASDNRRTLRGLHGAAEQFDKLNTEVHSRFSLACSCFFFALLGGPFAVLKAKAQFLTSFLYCFVPIVTGYYPLVLSLMVQAKKGHLDPSWSMWVGNGVLALAAFVVLRRVLRN